jgi:dTDP-4-dehydrorhamnose 3,5-epimerase-like enzyme
VTDLPTGCGLIDLAIRGDDRGSLIAIEGGANVPFEIARVYYIFDTTEGTARGFHAHHDLQQLAVCVSGSCVMVLDDGKRRYRSLLDSPNRGLLIGSPIWREMTDFSPDCVLLVLASAPFQDTDYIRDYENFLAIAERRQGGLT